MSVTSADRQTDKHMRTRTDAFKTIPVLPAAEQHAWHEGSNNTLNIVYGADLYTVLMTKKLRCSL